MGPFDPIPLTPLENHLFILQLPSEVQLLPEEHYSVRNYTICCDHCVVSKVKPAIVAHKAIVRILPESAEISNIAFSLRSNVAPIPTMASRRQFSLCPALESEYKPASDFLVVDKENKEAKDVQVAVRRFKSYRDFCESFGNLEIHQEIDHISAEMRKDTSPLKFEPENSTIFDFYFDIMQYKFSRHLIKYLNGNRASYTPFIEQLAREIGDSPDWAKSVARLMRSAGYRANFISVIARVGK